MTFDPLTGAARHVASRSAFLATPAPGPEAHATVKGFLRDQRALFGHGPEVLEPARIHRDSIGRRNGVRTVIWEQQLNDIPVFEGIFIAHTTGGGELASVSSKFIADLEGAAERGIPNWAVKIAKLPISEQLAIVLAAKNLGNQLRLEEVEPGVPALAGRPHKRYRTGKHPRPALVKLVWLPISPTAMRLAWEVHLARDLDGDMYRLLVDAETGDVVLRHLRTFYLSEASYRVFTGPSPAPLSPAHPTPSTNQAPVVPRELVTLSALSTNASPIGWISDGETETRGNNVAAHLDRNADDLPDLPRPHGGPGRVFDFPLDFALPPQSSGEAAVVNLFYWCNWMHDRLYELGFDEAAGNFQKDNFGRGGADNDAMLADAQDGSGVNNARYFPVPDGMAGHIEMFLFNGGDPDRDAALDTDIILHEYTHGLTDRSVGGGIGIWELVTAGLAEGWSDFYAISLLNGGSDLDATYTEGGYSTYQLFGLMHNYYFGIRRYPYTTDMTKNPLTFKDIDPGQITSYPNVPRSPIHPFNPHVAQLPHRAGELWCVTLWEGRANLIRKHGFPAGNELMLQLVTDALTLSPPNPTFLQARDAILLADRLLTGGANQSELWTAFAKRGMGIHATDPPNTTTEGVRQSFDRPDTLTIVPLAGLRFSGPSGGPIDPACRSLTLTNPTASPMAWGVSSPEPHFMVSASSGTLAPGEGASIDVCPLPGTLLLAPGTYTTSFFITNLTTGVAHRRDLTVQILHLAKMPFTEDFETEELADFWSLSGIGLTRTLLTTNNGPHGGDRHLTLASGAVGIYARNEATLAIDLAGYTNVVVRFWAKEFNDEPQGPPAAPFFDSADFDGVAISVDGHTWYEAEGLRRLRPDYSRIAVDLDRTLATHGLAYNGWFRIRFNQADTEPIPADGIAIDDISITGIAPRRFSISLPQVVNEGAGTISGQAFVHLPVAPAQDVNIQLASSNPEAVAVPANVILRAGTTSVAFDLLLNDDDLLDGEQTATITVSASGFHPGEGTLRVADNETAALSLSVEQSELIEGRGLIANAGRLTLDRAPTRDLVVQLVASDPNVLGVPAGVIVRADRTFATFNVFVADDAALDGPQAVTLTARLTEGVEAAITLSIGDNETTNLLVTAPALLNEASSSLASVGTVRISGTLPTNVTVSLTSSHTNKLRVPPAVAILAGRISANFNITLLDDLVTNSAQVITISASAPGFAPDDTAVRLLDNDFAPSAYNPRPRQFATTNAQGVQLAWDLGVPELIVNGGFETGDFSGWTKLTTPGGDFVLNSGAVDPPGPEGRTAPYAGRFSALSQQNSPGQRTLFQDVSLPLFFDSAVLNWTDRIHNHAGEFSDQHSFRVEIRTLDNDVLAVPFDTQAGAPLFSDWQEHSFNLQNFRGNTIRIAFVETDSLGFLNVALDNVRIFLSSPGPVTSEVYMGPNTNLGPVNFLGATTNTFWPLPPLALESQYYWRVVTRRGDARTVNPTWQFSTRGLGPVDHLVWNPIAPEQRFGEPFPASILAKDRDGNTVTNFSRSVFLSARMPNAPEPVQVLTFAGFHVNAREHRRTLAAISLYFTNYVESVFTGTDPAVLEAQLSGKHVLLVLEQDGAPVDRMAPLGVAWGPVLDTFLSRGGIVIVCSHLRDEHEILNSSSLMQLTKVSPYPAAELRVTGSHPLVEGVPSSFSGVNLSSYTSDNATALVRLTNSNASMVLTRAHGPGHIIMIGTDYSVNRTGFDRIMANAVKLAQGPISVPVAVVPPMTGYFVNGMWSGNVSVLAAGSNIVLTADDGEGHTGQSSPLSVFAENDLSVTLLDAPDPVTLGSNILYTAQVQNSGPGTAAGVTLTIEIPEGIDLLNATPSQGSCSVSNNILTCQLGAIGPDAGAHVRLDTSPQTAGTFFLVAVVAAGGEDPYPANNTDAASTIVGYPSIFIFSRGVAEGQIGSNTVMLSFELRPSSSKTVTVQYATANLSATAGLDYVAQAGLITFTPGQTNHSINFTVLADRLHEGPDEVFAVNLFNPSNAILAEAQGVGVIQDDDPAPGLSIMDAGILEGRDGANTQAVFSIQLATNSGVTVKAKFATVPGSASRVQDYLTTSGSITLPPGVTSTSIVVTVRGDQLSETNETFLVQVSDVTGATLARGQAIGTIIDDDAGAVDRLVWDTIPAVQQYGVPFPVTITARDALGNVAPAFAGPVSLAGWAAARQSTIGPGGQSSRFPMGTYFHDQRVQAIYTQPEVGEASRITALSLLVLTPPAQTMNRWTIRMKHSPTNQFEHPVWEQDWQTVYQDNETLINGGWVTFQFSEPFEYNGVENLLVDFSFNNASFTVDGQCDITPTADLRSQSFRTDSAYGDPLTWSGSEPPADLGRWVPSVQFFVERHIEILPLATGPFVNGVWTGTVAVFDVVDDMSLRADDEQNHSGSANLFSIVTTNDIAITAGDAPDPARVGDAMTFTYHVTNSGPSTASALVLSNRLPATAVAVSAQASQGACTVSDALVQCALGDLAAGAIATVTVQAVPHESGFITNEVSVAGQQSELFLGNNVAQTVTRVNPRAIFISGTTVTEAIDPFTNAVFTIRLSSASTREITVEYFTSDLTASNNFDFLERTGVLVFAPGVTNLTLIVPVINDFNDEPNEVFRLNLKNPTNAIVVGDFATATVIDNDGPPLATVSDASLVEPNNGPAFLSFPIRIDPPSGFFANVTVVTSNGTAIAGSDYFGQTFNLLVPPGFTNRVINVSVFGERLVEPDETFFLRFSNPNNILLSTNLARGTIINDDGLPGIVEYFEWNHVPSPQRVNHPIPVALTARDSLGNQVTNYSGGTLLRGRVGPADIRVGANNEQLQYPFAASSHDSRSGVIYLANELGGARRITGLALEVLLPPGQPLNRWTIRMKHTPLTNLISATGWETNNWTTVYQRNEIIDRTGWVNFIFDTPFDYNGTNNLFVDFSFNNHYFTVDGQIRFTVTNQLRMQATVSDSQFGDPLNWFSSPGGQLISGIPNVQFLSGAPVEITPEVSTAFTNGLWSGLLTVLGPATNMYFIADDVLGHVGLSAQFTAEYIPDFDGDGLLDEWELEYFGALDASAQLDPDDDGLTNLQEQSAGTNPLDAASVLRVVAVEFNGADVNIQFTSVTGKTYRVERADQPTGPWTPVANNLPGINGILQVTDFNAAPASKRFYRARLLP